MKKVLRWGFVFLLFAALVFPALPAAAQENPFEKGIQAYMKKDFKTASKFLREHVDKSPDAYAYYLLGYSYYKLRMHQESRRFFQDAYVLDPLISPGSVAEFIRKKA
jgi:TolA-binding protein